MGYLHLYTSLIFLILFFLIFFLVFTIMSLTISLIVSLIICLNTKSWEYFFNLLLCFFNIELKTGKLLISLNLNSFALKPSSKS